MVVILVSKNIPDLLSFGVQVISPMIINELKLIYMKPISSMVINVSRIKQSAP